MSSLKRTCYTTIIANMYVELYAAVFIILHYPFICIVYALHYLHTDTCHFLSVELDGVE